MEAFDFDQIFNKIGVTETSKVESHADILNEMSIEEVRGVIAFHDEVVNTRKIALRTIETAVTRLKSVKPSYRVDVKPDGRKVYNPSGTTDYYYYLDYDEMIRKYSKVGFDPFSRGRKFVEVDGLIFSERQVRFFRWLRDNGMIEFIAANVDLIKSLQKQENFRASIPPHIKRLQPDTAFGLWV